MNPAQIDNVFPCPECGNQRLNQEVRQYETIEVDADGNYEHISPLDETELLAVYCDNCEEYIWERPDK